MKFNEYHRYDAVGLAELIRKKKSPPLKCCRLL